MQYLQRRPLRRNPIPKRTVYVGQRGFRRRYRWSRPFVVDIYRQQPLELAVQR